MKNIRRKAAIATITFLGAGLALDLLVSRAPAGPPPLPQNTTDQSVAVDSFRLGLSAMILDRPEAFRIQELAVTLSQFRVGGYPVCAEDEISAAQYIELVEIDEKLSDYAPTVASQLHSILESSQPISDCQFRVLEAAISKAHPRR